MLFVLFFIGKSPDWIMHMHFIYINFVHKIFNINACKL